MISSLIAIPDSSALLFGRTSSTIIFPFLNLILNPNPK